MPPSHPIATPPYKPHNTHNARNARIDAIRVFLTALVIFHHTAITYGALGGWYFKEPRTVNLGSALLTIFCTVNQAYFMGFFFLLAGYYTPGACASKGLAAFTRARLVRLGIPIVIYGFLIGPATVALVPKSDGGAWTARYAARLARGDFDIGPLWFAEALLIFTAGYIVWRLAVSRRARHARHAPPAREEAAGGLRPTHRDHLVLAVGVAVVGASAFLIRLVFPVGQNVFGLQLAYFASYVYLFILGCAAASGGLLEAVDGRFARPWIALAVIALPLFFVYAIASGVLRGVPFQSSGGFNLPALAYAFWEPLVAWGIILAFLSWARGGRGKPPGLVSRLAPQVFAAYIIHPPILVGAAILLHGWHAPAFAKFLLVGSLATSASFLVAGLLRRLPGVARVV